MATNRPFTGPEDPEDIDLTVPPPGPPPDPNMIWFGSAGWKRVVVDDPEDREPLES